MTQALVRKGFETALKAWAAAQTPAIPIAWENVAFSPPEGRYIRAFVLPADTGSIDLAGAHRVYAGVFQITLCLPAGTGPGQAETLLAALDALFPVATPLIAGGLRIFFSPPSAAAPLPEPGRYVVPVSIRYRADAI